MKLRIGQFCSLAASPTFQSWLYKTDIDVYRIYQRQMRSSKGCAENKTVMEETLQLLRDANKEVELYTFLKAAYPNMIEGYVSRPTIAEGDVFPEFNPDILTYPHRIIFEGLKEPYLKRKVQSFLLNKIKSDYIIIDDKAYVEYLSEDDKQVVDQIPLSNWLVSQYRLKNQI